MVSHGHVLIKEPLLGGSLADLWHADERGVPMSIFSGAPFLGPIMGKSSHESVKQVCRCLTSVIGPLIGGFTYENLGWRWLYYLQLILAGFLYVCVSAPVRDRLEIPYMVSSLQTDNIRAVR